MNLMPGAGAVESLFEDLAQLTQIAQSGVISRRELRLEPGEERNAAVLFLDVVGFTELARVLPSDHLARLIDRSFRIFELAVQSLGGYCDKVIGDAALYVFLGHPSYPPACESACRAALGIQERVRQINATLAGAGLSINVRCGVAYGHVTRQRVGGESQQVTVMGDTVNIAQRLENSAAAGTIQATIRVLDKTAGLVRSAPRGTVELKGFGPVAVHVVTGVSEPELRLRTTRAELSPLVGRDALLDELGAQAADWLDAPADGAPGPNRLLVLRGPAAVGKTRLAYELVQRLKARRPLLTASAHATPAATLTGFAAELCRVAGLSATGLAAQWEELSRGRRGMAEHLPLLALLLDSPEADTSGIRQASPADLLLACQLALQAVIEMAGSGGHRAAGTSPGAGSNLGLRTLALPVVLVIEDLQWLGGLAPLVAHLLAHVHAAAPLLIVGTARPEFLVGAELAPPASDDASKPGRASSAPTTVIDLQPLGPAEGEALLAALLPGVALPPAVAAELHEKAAGLPYYYEEFARMLVRRGIAAPVGAGPAPSAPAAGSSDAGSRGGPRPGATEVDATLADGAGPVPTAYELIRELDELLIPDDVQMLVLGRLDMLEADLKELVLRASVLGRSFQFGLLSALEERLGFSGPDYPARPLAALTAQSVLRSDAPGDAYFFEHLLTREAAYRALLPHNRRVLHSAAADILAALLRPGTVDEWAQLPELARHLAAAGRYAEAHTRWTELLLTAATTGRDAQWEEWEAAALDALRAAHPGDAAPPCTSAGLELARTEVVMRQMQYVPARAGFARALDLAAAAHDKRIEALALRRLGLLEIQRGDEAAAEAQLRRSLELMRELDNPGGQAAVYSQLLYLYRELQRYAEAEDCARRGLELARSAGDLRAQASLFNNLGLVLQATRGRLDEALECYVQALELNRAIGNRVGEAINADNLGGLCLTLGRSAEARRLLELAVQRYGEVGDTPGVGSAGGKLGLLQLRSGELEQAAATLQRSHAVLRVLDEPFWQALTEVYLGDLHLAQGDLAGARAWFEAAQATGADRDSPLINSAAAQGLAETAIAEGDFAAAERELGSARREAQRLGEAGDALQVDVLAARLQLARHAAAAGTGPDGASALEALRTTLDGLAERALELGLGPDSTALRNIRGLQAQAGGAAA